MTGWLGVAGFLFATAVTPGPNNLVVLRLAGARGFKAAIPAAVGVVVLAVKSRAVDD